MFKTLAGPFYQLPMARKLKISIWKDGTYSFCASLYHPYNVLYPLPSAIIQESLMESWRNNIAQIQTIFWPKMFVPFLFTFVP